MDTLQFAIDKQGPSPIYHQLHEHLKHLISGRPLSLYDPSTASIRKEVAYSLKLYTLAQHAGPAFRLTQRTQG